MQNNDRPTQNKAPERVVAWLKHHRPPFVMACTAIAMGFALLQAVRHWQQYQVIEAISTAFVHVPMAAFGTSVAWGFVHKKPLFSFVGMAFAILNAALV